MRKSITSGSRHSPIFQRIRNKMIFATSFPCEIRRNDSIDGRVLGRMDEWTREEKFALQEPEMKQLSRLYLVAGISTSLAVISAAMNPVRAQENYSAVGVFESHQDVGKVLHPG